MGMMLFRCNLAFVLFATTALIPNIGRASDMHPEVLERFGGVWSSDCGQARAPRVTVSAETLVFEAEGRRVVGQNALSGYSMFGQMEPPEGFVVGLLSSSVEAFAYTSAQGDYLSLTSVGGLADVDYEARLFNCDAARRTASVSLYEASQAAMAAAEAEQEACSGDMDRLRDAGTLLERDPTFRRAWLAILGPLARDPWLTTLEGPRVASSLETVSGVEYQALNGCKPHDCADNHFVALYDRVGGKVYGLLRWRGQRPALLGDPPSALAGALRDLLSNTWGDR